MSTAKSSTGRYGPPPADVDRLEAAEADRADHQHRRHEHHRERPRERGRDRSSARSGEQEDGRRASTPAAGGLGMPTKYRLSACEARLDVEARQPHRRGASRRRSPRPIRAARAADRPHANARTAGARPNDMTSASESSSTPNALVVPVSRAMRPSSMSSTIAMPMNGAAVSQLAAHRVDDARVAAEQVADRQRLGSRNTPRRARCGGPARRRSGGRMDIMMAGNGTVAGRRAGRRARGGGRDRPRPPARQKTQCGSAAAPARRSRSVASMRSFNASFRFFRNASSYCCCGVR